MKFWLSVLPIIFMLPFCAAGAPLYTVTDIGTLGGSYTFGNGINNSGQITGASSLPGDQVDHAFLYSKGVMTDLGGFGGNSSGQAINDSGQIIGQFYASFNQTSHSFLYSNGIATDIGPIFGAAINTFGVVTGTAGSSYASGQAITYKNGVVTYLGVYGNGAGINDSGQLLLGTYNPTNLGPVAHVFLYSQGVLTDLGTLGGEFSRGMAINNAGQVVGGSATSGYDREHAFLYRNGVLTDLGTLPGGTNSLAFAINHAGQITGRSDTALEPNHAFLYSNGVMTDLNADIDPALGILLLEGTGINDAGQIIADGVPVNTFQSHTYLLTPISSVPEPSAFALLGAGLGAVYLGRKFNRYQLRVA